MLRAKKAQSTLEYVIILTAIVGAIIYAAATYIRPGVESSYKNVNESIQATAANLTAKITP